MWTCSQVEIFVAIRSISLSNGTAGRKSYRGLSTPAIRFPWFYDPPMAYMFSIIFVLLCANTLPSLTSPFHRIYSTHAHLRQTQHYTLWPNESARPRYKVYKITSLSKLHWLYSRLLPGPKHFTRQCTRAHIHAFQTHANVTRVRDFLILFWQGKKRLNVNYSFFFIEMHLLFYWFF